VHLSDWRGRAPHKDALSPRVLAVVEPVLTTLGSDPDPGCWVSWGDDPSTRYLILVPTAAGLVEVHVRVNVPGEGPRASGKLVRWNRVTTGELAIEVAGGHRLLAFQVEGQVLHGKDADADPIAAFALGLFAAMDGRIPPAAPSATAGRGRVRPASTTKAAAGPSRGSGAGRKPPKAGEP
jgi:hypothetical protein